MLNASSNLKVESESEDDSSDIVINTGSGAMLTSNTYKDPTPEFKDEDETPNLETNASEKYLCSLHRSRRSITFFWCLGQSAKAAALWTIGDRKDSS